jgi:hypothetical protein
MVHAIRTETLSTAEILHAALAILPSHSHCRDMVATYSPIGHTTRPTDPDCVLNFAYDAAYSCVEGFGHHTAPEYYGAPKV